WWFPVQRENAVVWGGPGPPMSLRAPRRRGPRPAGGKKDGLGRAGAPPLPCAARLKVHVGVPRRDLGRLESGAAARNDLVDPELRDETQEPVGLMGSRNDGARARELAGVAHPDRLPVSVLRDLER